MVIQIVAFVLPLAKSWTRLKPQIPEIVIWEKIEQSWLLSRCVLLSTSLVSEWYVIFLNLDSLLIIYYRTNKSEVLLFLKVKSLQLRIYWPSSNFCKKPTHQKIFCWFWIWIKYECLSNVLFSGIKNETTNLQILFWQI